ncbi:cinnamyl alcohol dehydrogenase 1 [Cinnamomum micranthum f. kanehirae]|uniref:Cinnamyl alcohol dehydrogenase 1 n=1 Tax=Cinnamomum micranthum f. kanehirae TaxID=337451 RepID=A0A3S3NZ34_9MAGN|nr:cinnamyl alcohol dehydrogenase 1 [Cinnamomum micranthum f. kanehirae]
MKEGLYYAYLVNGEINNLHKEYSMLFYILISRKTGPEDVAFKVLYCGVDHTDLHQMRNMLHMTTYSLFPGHEVVGVVIELGSEVKKFRLGEIIGVGGIIGSCGECSSCTSNIEQYCSDRIFTYNGIYKDGKPTQGGFASGMVVHHKFVVKIPDKPHRNRRPHYCALG